MKKHINIVKILLKQGSSPNIKNKNGYTALIHAINNKDLDMVKLLLKYGADPTIIHKGWSALMHAKHLGYNEIVEWLLKGSTKRSGIDISQ